MKVLICFGTRPEAIKMAPVIFALKERNILFKVCVTAQHREMLDQVLDFFEIIPDYDLNVMTSRQSLNSLSSSILLNLDKILETENPDIILVQGDTTTAFIAAFASFHKKIKIGHIEAGLRTFNKNEPFPEEANRQLISRISNFHFVPTDTARENLLREGIPEASILKTGNTVVDALEWSKKRLKDGYQVKGITGLKNKITVGKRLILVTAHRRENIGNGLNELCEALKELAGRNDLQIFFPVHLNPQVKELIYKKLDGIENIILCLPLDYPSFLWLLEQSSLIISDSGGIQEEAPSFRKPVLVTRETSERMEGVEVGWAFTVGSNREKIVKKSIEIIENPEEAFIEGNPYGDGKAAQRIANFLLAEAGKNL